MNNKFEDGRELFAEFAAKIMRGELVLTHFNAYIEPGPERRSVATMTGEAWEGSRFRAKLTVVEPDFAGQSQPPVSVTMPAQVRELIFDEPVRPVYDEDLKD